MTAAPRPRGGEAGFTLLELLVGVALIGLVAAAIFGVYSVTQSTTFAATAREDALVSARAAIERFAADLRAINAGRQGNTGAITAATAAGLTFLGVDATAAAPTLTAAVAVDATTIQVGSAAGLGVGTVVTIEPYFESRTITAVAGTTLTLDTELCIPYPAGAAVRTIATINYTYAANGTHGTLTRAVNGVADPPLLDNLSGFQITYWDGSTPPVQTAVLEQIREIRVQLTTTAVSGSQTASRTLTLNLRPRNLSKVPGSGTSGI